MVNEYEPTDKSVILAERRIPRKTRIQDLQQQLYTHREYYQHLYIHRHIPKTHRFHYNALDEFPALACSACYPITQPTDSAFNKYCEILKRFDGRVSQVTHDRFIDLQNSTRKFGPAVKVIATTVFPKPPSTVSSLLTALTKPGEPKLLDYNVERAIDKERAEELSQQVNDYLCEKQNAAEKGKGKTVERLSIGSTSKTSDNEYQTPELGPLYIASDDEKDKEIAALESIGQRATDTESENDTTNPFNQRKLPALDDIFANLNLADNQGENPDQADNQGSDQENVQTVDDQEVAEVNEVLVGEVRKLKEKFARLEAKPQQRQYAPQRQYEPQQRRYIPNNVKENRSVTSDAFTVEDWDIDNSIAD